MEDLLLLHDISIFIIRHLKVFDARSSTHELNFSYDHISKLKLRYFIKFGGAISMAVNASWEEEERKSEATFHRNLIRKHAS